MAGKSLNKSPSLTSGLLPALAFTLGLAVLVAAAYDMGHGASTPPEKRYASARAALEGLRVDARRNVYRDQWLRLADEFYSIYTDGADWANRPAALFRSAEALEELGLRSAAAKDHARAAERYERLTEKHAASRLADDALLRSATIRARYLNDREGSLRLLRRIRAQYPRGDMAAEAALLEKELLAAVGSASSPRAAPEKAAASEQAAAQVPAQRKKAPHEGAAELTRVSWSTLNRNKVRIIVELDRHAPWQARMREAGQGRPARVILEMRDAVPAERASSGARVKNSPLTRVLVSQNGQDGRRNTTLAFDFTSARRYDARVEQNPFRIVLTVLAGDAAPSRGLGARAGFAELAQPTPGGERINAARSLSASARGNAGGQRAATLAGPAGSGDFGGTALSSTASVAGNMAAQLGLTVRSVFIDAGHGGKDPGTIHNGLVERDVALDIARRVGGLLTAKGLEVEYSRTGDVAMPLSARPRRANSVRADLFVSIHVNAGSDASAHGFETYYLDLARNAQAARVATLENAASDRKLGDMQSVLAEVMLNARTQESTRLAADVQRMAISRLKRRGYATRDGGTRSAPFHVLIGAGMPAILVEAGYCTHRKEAALLGSSAYRQVLAEGIAEGVLAYKNRLQHRHSAQIVLTGKSGSAI